MKQPGPAIGRPRLPQSHLAIHAGGGGARLSSGRQPLPQSFHQFGTAPAERQHPDHRRLRRSHHRGHPGARHRLGVHQPLLGKDDEDQPDLEVLPGSL
jgi:hypothetical protein